MLHSRFNCTLSGLQGAEKEETKSRGHYISMFNPLFTLQLKLVLEITLLCTLQHLEEQYNIFALLTNTDASESFHSNFNVSIFSFCNVLKCLNGIKK